MSEAYAKAIELIAKDKVDYREVGVRLAQVSPEMFVKLVEFEPDVESVKSRMDREILQMNKRGERVAAIKHCRTVTGWGLKEAKDYCDAIGSESKATNEQKASVGNLLAAFSAVTGIAPMSVLTDAYNEKGSF